MAKAVISSTYDDKYLYFIPIVTWCWNKLGVDVICFMPAPNVSDMEKLLLISNTMGDKDMKFNGHYFSMPEHKQATAAQCSRLYGACLDLPEDEVLITGDVDMATFSLPSFVCPTDGIMVYGHDLVPEGQYPMCYLSGTVNQWRNVFELKDKTYQQCLDDLLGDIECESFRGNYWGKDQEEAYNKISKVNGYLVPRARQGTQFASHRVDRDDINWRSYVNDELIDAHLWRDGFTDPNHANIMELMRMKFPDEDFTWLDTYRNEYLKLL